MAWGADCQSEKFERNPTQASSFLAASDGQGHWIYCRVLFFLKRNRFWLALALDTIQISLKKNPGLGGMPWQQPGGANHCRRRRRLFGMGLGHARVTCPSCSVAARQLIAPDAAVRGEGRGGAPAGCPSGRVAFQDRPPTCDGERCAWGP